jgi:hypothetical protein
VADNLAKRGVHLHSGELPARCARRGRLAQDGAVLH